jgi:hypothetical protein
MQELYLVVLGERSESTSSSKSNINKYKNRTSVHENQLIKDLFTQTLEERKLKRIWPEDLLGEV